jgi:hypothetical protein
VTSSLQTVAAPPSPSSGTVDFDLHGVVGVRLLDATPGDAATVARQLGPIQSRLPREPEITIQFVDHLSRSSPVRQLGPDCGYTDDGFLVLRTRHAPVRVKLPMERIGQGPLTITCERRVPAVPLLVPIINLTALSRGVVPLHASAFIYDGQGSVVTGWSKGGKTEMLLAYMARGAQYVGDEWVYLLDDGQRVGGIPEPVRVWDWHLAELPEYRGRLGRSERARLRFLKAADRACRRSGLGSRDAVGKLLPMLSRQLHADVPPARLFSADVGVQTGPFDCLLFVMNHASSAVVVRPVDTEDVARRMVFSLECERLDFRSYYERFLFAFPEARNSVIDGAEELQRALLTRSFAGKPAWEIAHPYPVSLRALFEATRHLAGGGRGV